MLLLARERWPKWSSGSVAEKNEARQLIFDDPSRFKS
jgi:hypothetical protein